MLNRVYLSYLIFARGPCNIAQSVINLGVLGAVLLLLCCGACRRICKKNPTTNGDYITVQTNSPAVLPTETPITRQEKRKRFLIKKKNAVDLQWGGDSCGSNN